MDPATLIVMALVRALTTSLAPVAQRAAMDGYELLKTSIIRQYGSPVAAGIQQLEQQPESVNSQAVLKRELSAAGADQDTEIIDLANDLARLIENPPSFDPVESVERRAGEHALHDVMTTHLENLMRVRSTYRVGDSDLLTSNITNRSDVPASVRAELTQLHTRMREIIERVARKMEERQYRDTEEAIDDVRFGLTERERAIELIAADKEVHVSYQTLRLVVEFFGVFNQKILTSIEQEALPARQANMMLGNAVMVYELTDFVIAYIESFTLRGVDQINSIHASFTQRIDAFRAQQQALEEHARGGAVESSVRDQTLLDTQNRQKAINELENEWKRYAGEINQLDSVLDDVRGKVPTLEVIRENAAVQISLLQLVALLRFLKQNSVAIKGTIDAVQGFRLAPLTSNRVRRLLNV